MEKNQNRGIILSDRLSLINDFLEAENGRSFDIFLKEKNISKTDFIEGLPRMYHNPPTQDRKKIMAYGKALNNEYFNQYIQHQASLGLDGEGDPIGWDAIDHDADGYQSGVVHEGDKYYASGKWRKKLKEKLQGLKNKLPKKGKESKTLHELNKYNPAFVAARNSYRLLIRFNVGRWAYNLGRIHDRNAALWKKVKTKWYNIGGSESELIKSINEGKNKKPIFKRRGADGSYSFDPVTDTAAAIAVAAPIIAAIMPIIKQFKKENNEPTDTQETEAPPTGNTELDKTLTEDTVVDTDGNPTPDKPGFWATYKIPVIVGGSILGVGAIIWVVVALSNKNSK